MKENTFRQRHGPEAVTAIEDLIAVLKIRLQEESAYVSLWEDFAAEPRATIDELTGALEALIEADPALAERLEAFFEEYRDVTTRTPAERGGNLAPRERPAPQLPAGPSDYSEVGTYLYGNLSPGTVTLNESGESIVSAGEPDITVATPHVGQGIALFQDMYTFVEETENLSQDTRLKLRAELEQLATDIAEGEEAYEQSIVGHLDTVKRSVLTDPQENRATHLVIAKGLLSTTRKLIPTSWVSVVMPEEVHLAVSSGLIERLREYEPKES